MRRDIMARLAELEVRLNPPGTIEKALDRAEAALGAEARLADAKALGADERELAALERELQAAQAAMAKLGMDTKLDAAIDAAERDAVRLLATTDAIRGERYAPLGGDRPREFPLL